MVFFTCNACGESLKKNKVESHWRSVCPDCSVLTCVDCLKDFPGDSYAAHTKCITEEQKYNGKAFNQRANNGNKGERKQQAWLERLQELSQSSEVSPQVQSVLDVMLNFENVPRKRAKFINFARNCVRHVRPAVIEQTWTLFESALQNKGGDNGAKEGNGEQNKSDSNVSHSNGKENEERHNKENGDSNVKEKERSQSEENESGHCKEDGSRKDKKGPSKSKKNVVSNGKNGLKNEENHGEEEFLSNSDRVLGENSDNEVEVRRGVPMFKGIEKKKKKRRHEDQEKGTEGKEEVDVKRSKVNENDEGKFDWEATMCSLLESKDSMKLVRLQKKVVDAFLASRSTHLSREKLMKKVEKKAKKNPKFKLLKERVQLVK